MDKFLIGMYVITTAGGLILLKLSANGQPFLSFVDGRIIWNLSFMTFLGIGLYGSSFLLYLLLISKFNLGFIIPLTTGLVYTLIFIASFTIFKENFTSAKIVAIILILAGIVLLNTSSKEELSTAGKSSNQEVLDEKINV